MSGSRTVTINKRIRALSLSALSPISHIISFGVWARPFFLSVPNAWRYIRSLVQGVQDILPPCSSLSEPNPEHAA